MAAGAAVVAVVAAAATVMAVAVVVAVAEITILIFYIICYIAQGVGYNALKNYMGVEWGSVCKRAKIACGLNGEVFVS